MSYNLTKVVQGLMDYDAGLLNDFGGGDVNWWQDYLRAEIERANEFWREQVEQVLADGVRGAYHPCTSILIEGLKRLEGGSDVLAEWDRARAKVDTASLEARDLAGDL